MPVISEILMQDPNTTFYYGVGAEFPSGQVEVRENTGYGDGQVMFFIGSPASFRYSSSYKSGRCHGLGGITIENLRELIKARKV